MWLIIGNKALLDNGVVITIYLLILQLVKRNAILTKIFPNTKFISGQYSKAKTNYTKFPLSIRHLISKLSLK